MEKTGEVEGAHIMPVRDIDFAKIQNHLLASGGDDHKVCLWDLRCAPSTTLPLVSVGI